MVVRLTFNSIFKFMRLELKFKLNIMLNEEIVDIIPFISVMASIYICAEFMLKMG